jgi:hypothetical protein
LAVLGGAEAMATISEALAKRNKGFHRVGSQYQLLSLQKTDGKVEKHPSLVTLFSPQTINMQCVFLSPTLYSPESKSMPGLLLKNPIETSSYNKRKT